MDASEGTKGFLHAVVTHKDGNRTVVRSVEDFLKKFVKGTEDAITKEVYLTNLMAHHFDGEGVLKNVHDLGSGLTTVTSSILLANDPTWVAASTPFSTLSAMKYVATGTGATAAAAADYSLQAPIASGSLTGSTNGYFTGAITNGGNAAGNQWKNVATVVYGSSQAVTEWGLFMSNAAPFTGTATGANTATALIASGGAFTTAGNGLAGWAVEINSTAINTPTTTVYGIVTSNTSTQLNVAGGWVTLANAGGATPGNVAYVVYPGMFDHKVFSVINVNSGDSIQFTYTLTVNSGT